MLFCAGQGRPALGAKKRFNYWVLLQSQELYRRVPLGCGNVDYAGKYVTRRCWASFRTTPERGRSSSAPKTLAFSRAVEFGRARMAEQGLRPAALFAVRVVFEVVALICGNLSDTCDLYPQKARSSCGRDPRSRRRAAVTQRPRAC